MRYCVLAIVMVSMFVSSLAAAEPPSSEPGDLKVLSFNIRYGTAKDGENHWDKRKDFVAATIKKHNPDLLGTQETLDFQAAYLREQLPGYTFVGAGRDDGKAGEMAALFFRTDRFEKLDEGHYWHSETPDKPGSKGWDTSLPRITTWVKLKEKEGKHAGRVIHFFNTHFDHMGKQARVESAKLMRRKITALGENATVVVTGDFNAGEASEPYKNLVSDEKTTDKPKLIDTFRQAVPTRGKEEGTTNGFKGGREGARIDWILCTPGLTATAAGIDFVDRDGRFPSDHYPVWAVLRQEPK